MASDSRSIGRTLPNAGSYSITSSTTAASRYPDDGVGTPTATVGDAHWTDLGLAAGGFEVEVTAIVTAAGGVTILTDLTGSGVAHAFPGGGSIAAGGGGVPSNLSFAPGCGPRMKDGFVVTFSGAGGTVFYRIHVYHKPKTS